MLALQFCVLLFDNYHREKSGQSPLNPAKVLSYNLLEHVVLLDEKVLGSVLLIAQLW